MCSYWIQYILDSLDPPAFQRFKIPKIVGGQGTPGTPMSGPIRVYKPNEYRSIYQIPFRSTLIKVHIKSQVDVMCDACFESNSIANNCNCSFSLSLGRRIVDHRWLPRDVSFLKLSVMIGRQKILWRLQNEINEWQIKQKNSNRLRDRHVRNRYVICIWLYGGYNSNTSHLLAIPTV